VRGMLIHLDRVSERIHARRWRFVCTSLSNGIRSTEGWVGLPAFLSGSGCSTAIRVLARRQPRHPSSVGLSLTYCVIYLSGVGVANSP